MICADLDYISIKNERQIVTVNFATILILELMVMHMQDRFVWNFSHTDISSVLDLNWLFARKYPNIVKTEWMIWFMNIEMQFSLLENVKRSKSKIQ